MIAADDTMLARSIARPEAEQAAAHDPSDGGEESSEALGNLGLRPTSTTPSKEGAGVVSSSATIEIKRATTRFALDLRLLSPVVEKKRAKAQVVEERRRQDPAIPVVEKAASGIVRPKRELSAEEKAARRALEDVSRAATTARNVALRALVRRDSEAIDAWLLAHGGAFPKKGDLEYPKSYSYKLIRQVAPRLASGMAATLAREVDGKWVRDRIEVLHFQERSAPHYRIGQPFPVRAQDIEWEWSDGAATAIVTLFSNGGGGSENCEHATKFRMPIVARDEYQRHTLKMLASGEWKAGEIKIERDRLQPAKWYMRVAYKRLVPLRLLGQPAAVCLGMRNFLVAVTADGDSWVYDGADVEAHLRRTQEMRRSYQRGVKASARVGRGRPVALRSIEHLAGKSERYRQTRCAVIARRLASWLRGKGVNMVYLSDFTGIRDAVPEGLSGSPQQRQIIWGRIQEWPFYMLSQKIICALESPLPHEAQEAIEVSPIEQDYHSQRCPACGFVSPKNRDFVSWKLRCANPAKSSRGRTGCGYVKMLDVAQCTNSLDRARGEKLPYAKD